MNKTITANISGIVFHIESDAYEKLNKYLSTIRHYFEKSEGAEEIMADIEARIAELFKEKLKNEREVITMEDVDSVIAIMGEPEQYIDSGEDFDSGYSESSYSHREKGFTRKLFRDPDDKVLGGVCSGIGYYFGIDRIWLRASFLIAVLAFGVGIVPYIILWIIIPLAKSSGDKLEMKGEPVTVDSIGRTVRDEFNSFKKKVNNDAFNENFGKVENILTQIFRFLVKLIVFLFKFIVKLLAFLILVFVGILLISIVTGFFAAPAFFNLGNENLNFVFQQEFAELIWDSSIMSMLGYIGLFLFICIPLIALIYAALKILLNFKFSNKLPGIVFGSFWMIGLFILLISAFNLSKEFSYKLSDTEVHKLNVLQGDTLYLGNLVSNIGHDDSWVYLENDSVYLSSLKVDVYETMGKDFELSSVKRVHAASRKQAQLKLQNMTARYSMQDSLLLIDQYFSFPKTDNYRNQEIKIRIGIPQGKVLYLRADSKAVIYDIENQSNTWDHEMLGHYWQMQARGLKCLDCSWEQEQTDSNDVDFQ